MVTIVCGIPYFLSIDHTDGLCKQSKAFQKSMKFIITGFCHAVTFSMICLSVNIWSLHDLPGLNPACSVRRCISTPSLSLLSNILANTLSGTDNKVMPRQLLQSDKSPFFGRGIIIMTSLQSVGTSCFCHTVLNRFVRRSLIDSACFSNSGWMWSEPAALLFFSFLTARATSSSIFDFTYSNQIFRCSKYQLLTYLIRSGDLLLPDLTFASRSIINYYKLLHGSPTCMPTQFNQLVKTLKTPRATMHQTEC